MAGLLGGGGRRYAVASHLRRSSVYFVPVLCLYNAWLAPTILGATLVILGATHMLSGCCWGATRCRKGRPGRLAGEQNDENPMAPKSEAATMCLLGIGLDALAFAAFCCMGGHNSSRFLLNLVGIAKFCFGQMCTEMKKTSKKGAELCLEENYG